LPDPILGKKLKKPFAEESRVLNLKVMNSKPLERSCAPMYGFGN
jgi:hypothetical protein